jgi:dolichol-phosphate mannosyltransferase
MGTPTIPQPIIAPDLPRLLVVPAYNEEDNIPGLLEDLGRRPWLFTPGSRVLIVDDGSSDGTCDIVRAYRGPVPVQLVEQGINQGPGAAFARGFHEALTLADGEAFVVTLEADNTSDLDALGEMIKRCANSAGLVLASVHGGGTMINVSRTRRMLSVSAGVAVRRLLSLDAATVSSFFRVYRASALRTGFERYGDELIEERGFACKAELLSKLSSLGVTVEEVPVDLDASRRIGESKMPVFQTLAGYGRLFVRQRLQRGTPSS